MFLKELYQYNKLLFAALALFIISMAFINYKWGVVATPIQQYGMYSQRQYFSDTQKVYQLYVNGQKLNLSDFSLVERDMMQIPIDYFGRQEYINSQAFITMRSVFAKLKLDGLLQEKNFVNNTSNLQFYTWFKELVQKNIGNPVAQLEVFEEHYIWNKTKLELTGQPKKITILAVN